MAGIENIEWLNANQYRAYPFQEDAQRLPGDTAGNLIEDAQLPNYVIVDFTFSMGAAESVRLYLAQLAVVGNLLTLVFAETAAGTTITTVTVDRNTHVPNQAYALTGSGDASDGRGQIVIGDLERLDSDLSEGLYTYVPAQTLLEACAVHPAVRGVRSLQVQNLDSLSELLAGHVRLVAGENVTLTYDAAHNAIWINAGANTDYVEPCGCAAGAVQTNIVRTINGIALESVSIVGDGSCVEVTSDGGNTLLISDKCSEPCCGCPELQYLTESLKVMDTSLAKLEAFADRLDTRITDFVTNYVLTLGP